MKVILILSVFKFFYGVNAGFLPDLPKVSKNIENLAILPGTYWCGNGDIASSDEDLGLIKKTDKCCRAHDKCPDSIPAQGYKHALHNSGLFTRSHCDCDHAFYKCLEQAGNPLSISTGQTYFTLLGPQCFAKVHPITECKQKKFRRCIEYKFAEDEPEVWQWMDNPVFTKLI